MAVVAALPGGSWYHGRRSTLARPASAAQGSAPRDGGQYSSSCQVGRFPVMREMLRRIGVESERDSSPDARPVTWPWAAASIALVLLVAGALLIERKLSLAALHPTVAAAPSLPAIDAVAVAHPEAGARLYALDTSTGHLVAIAQPQEQMCPPSGNCLPLAPPDTITVLDGSSGQPLAATPLTGAAQPAAAAQALLVDPGRHLAYAVAPQSVTVFSTA